jgi:branched-chain amino acid transport system ATP-binding protein
MLKVIKIDSYYGGIQALSGITLEVGEKEIVCLIGANGAGKTTLLNVISCVLHPHKGKIEFLGRDITQFRAEMIVHAGIIQIPEGRELFNALTVKENLEMGAYIRFRKESKREISRDQDIIFDMFPVLKDRAGQLAGTLSGGEQQMLAIGRGLMGRPKLLLMDEPSLGLAPLIVKEIFSVIVRLKAEGIPILLVEQNAKAALNVSDKCYIMLIGRIIHSGSAAELKESVEIKKAFLGEVKGN